MSNAKRRQKRKNKFKLGYDTGDLIFTLSESPKKGQGRVANGIVILDDVTVKILKEVNSKTVNSEQKSEVRRQKSEVREQGAGNREQGTVNKKRRQYEAIIGRRGIFRAIGGIVRKSGRSTRGAFNKGYKRISKKSLSGAC